jgi:hypothetical protein
MPLASKFKGAITVLANEQKKPHYIYFSHLDSSQSVFKHTSSVLIMETNTDTL